MSEFEIKIGLFKLFISQLSQVNILVNKTWVSFISMLVWVYIKNNDFFLKRDFCWPLNSTASLVRSRAYEESEGSFCECCEFDVGRQFVGRELLGAKWLEPRSVYLRSAPAASPHSSPDRKSETRAIQTAKTNKRKRSHETERAMKDRRASSQPASRTLII